MKRADPFSPFPLERNFGWCRELPWDISLKKDSDTSELWGSGFKCPVPGMEFRIMLKMLWFPAKFIGKVSHFQIKTKPAG